MQSHNSILYDYNSIKDSFAYNLNLIQSMVAEAQRVEVDKDNNSTAIDTRGEEIKEADQKGNLQLNVGFLLVMAEHQKREAMSFRAGPTKAQITSWISQYHALLTKLKAKMTASGTISKNAEATLKSMLKKGEGIIEKLDKKIEETSIEESNKNLLVGATPLSVSRKAHGYLRNLNSYMIGSKKRDQVEHDLHANIIKILEKDTRTMSMHEIITFLTEASKQLTFIKQQWTNFQTFFQNIANVLKRSRDSVNMSIKLYRAMQVEEQYIPDMVVLFRRELKQNAVEALAFSIYTKRYVYFR